MSGFIEGEARTQATLFPERLDDYIAEENAVRVIDIFIDYIAVIRRIIDVLGGLKICHYFSNEGYYIQIT